MYRLCLVQLLLGIQWLQAAIIYDDSERLNLSASCPDAACSLWQLQSDIPHPLRYTGGQVTQLEELLLGDCRMRALPVELLRLVPNLRSLLILNSSVYHVYKEDFQATPKLRQLLLERSHLTRLKEQQFAALQQLQVLQLGHNNIQIVHAQAFEGLTQLQLLGLQGNGITQLTEGAFGPLPNLAHLDLSDNELKEISAQTFAQNGQLQTLLLNGNQLAQFAPNSLAMLTNLRLLDLSNSGQLEELHIHSAQKLLVESCGIRRLIIDGGVISLQAGKNALTQLSVGDKSAVIELDLHGNLLTGNATSTLLQGMWNLQRLDLARNNIDSLASNCSAFRLLLPSLAHLNLAHNQLKSLPPESALLPSHLVQLDISFNHMLAVNSMNFAALPSLQRLLMEGNRLDKFDHELFHRQHPQLQELGICDPGVGYGLMHKIMIYFSDRGVQLPVHCLHKPSTNLDSIHTVGPNPPEAHTRAGVTGIHPYWTTRDVLAFLTLLVVFIILLMQLYRILEEEGCLRRLRQRLTAGQPVVANGNRSRRLNEEDSESSSE